MLPIAVSGNKVGRAIVINSFGRSGMNGRIYNRLTAYVEDDLTVLGLSAEVT